MTLLAVRGIAKSGKDTISNMLIARYGYRKAHFAFELKRIAHEHFGWTGWLDEFGSWDGGKEPAGRHLLQQIGTEVGRVFHENIWLVKFLRRCELPRDVSSPLWRLPSEVISVDELIGRGEALVRKMGLLAAKGHLIAIADFGWDGRDELKGDAVASGLLALAHGYGIEKWNNAEFSLERFAEKVRREKEIGEGAAENCARLAVPDTRFPNEFDLLVGRGGVSVQVWRPGLEKMSHASETALDNVPFHVLLKNDGGPHEWEEVLSRKVGYLMELIPSLAGQPITETVEI